MRYTTPVPKPVKREKTPKPLRRGKPLKRDGFIRAVAEQLYDSPSVRAAAKKAWSSLQRSKPMRKRTSRRVAAKTPDEKRFLTWLHRQPCRGRSIPGHVCEGPIQAMHFRDHTGAGLCEAYATCVPGCRSLHDQYDRRCTPRDFVNAGYPTLEARKEWHRWQQFETQAAYAAVPSGKSTGASERGSE